MYSLGPDEAFKFFIISNCLVLILITGELNASTRYIVMSPCLDSLSQILNLVKDLCRSLHLLRTNLYGALKVLLTCLALPKRLMRIHIVEEHFVISPSLLATICPTLIKIVKQVVIHEQKCYTIKYFSNLINILNSINAGFWGFGVLEFWLN